MANKVPRTLVFRSNYKKLRLCVPGSGRKEFTPSGGTRVVRDAVIQFDNGRFEAHRTVEYGQFNAVTGERNRIDQVTFLLDHELNGVDFWRERGDEDLTAAFRAMVKAESEIPGTYTPDQLMQAAAAARAEQTRATRKFGPAVHKGVRSTAVDSLQVPASEVPEGKSAEQAVFVDMRAMLDGE